MTVTDLTREGLHNQKRGVCVVAGLDLAEADLLVDGARVAILPEESIITKVSLNVTTVSGTATSTLDVLVGAAVVANEMAVTVAGLIAGTLVTGEAYLPTGGDLILKAGAVTPADGALICDLIVEYIEREKVTGELTNYYVA